MDLDAYNAACKSSLQHSISDKTRDFLLKWVCIEKASAETMWLHFDELLKQYEYVKTCLEVEWKSIYGVTPLPLYPSNNGPSGRVDGWDTMLQAGV
jgi:hypothetical protein